MSAIGPALAAEPAKAEQPQPAAADDRSGAANADAYCRNIANKAADARYARQAESLAAMTKALDERIAALEAKRADYEKWVSRREDFLKRADESVVAIYSQMRPDAAAQQIAVMEQEAAAAILSKLQPRIASAILNEMDAGDRRPPDQRHGRDCPAPATQRKAEAREPHPARPGRSRSSWPAARPNRPRPPAAIRRCRSSARASASSGRRCRRPSPSPTSTRRTRCGASKNQGLFQDMRARKVGDIVTVVHRHQRQGAVRQYQRPVEGGQRQGHVRLRSRLGRLRHGRPGRARPRPIISASGSADAKGSGSIDRSEKLHLSIAAVVTEVLPEGNLLISGSQEVRVNREVRVLTIAGIVRPYDIADNNMVPYDKIAEARISYGGRGKISEMQ